MKNKWKPGTEECLTAPSPLRKSVPEPNRIQQLEPTHGQPRQTWVARVVLEEENQSFLNRSGGSGIGSLI